MFNEGFEKVALDMAGLGAKAGAFGRSALNFASANRKAIGGAAAAGAAGGALVGGLSKDQNGNRQGLGGAVKGAIGGAVGGAALGAGGAKYMQYRNNKNFANQQANYALNAASARQVN
jgi:hypothetical protein